MKTSVIAHRGASLDAPENTLAAFRLAWEQGADAIELDVHRTKDGRLVVIHDEDTKRTTGERGIVEQQSASSLKQLDAGVWKHGRWKGERIPVLEEALVEVPSGRRVYIELKTGAECLPELVRVLSECPLHPEQMVLMGFEYDRMHAVRAAIEECECGWIIDRPWKSPRLPRLIERAKEAGFLSLEFSSEWTLDEAMIEEVHLAGLLVNTWTVDEPRRARQLADAGIDGIITNAPRRIREALTVEEL